MDNQVKIDSCKYCRWVENCAGNDTGIYPCPDYVRVQEKSLRQHD